jgi:hypothetical protein
MNKFMNKFMKIVHEQNVIKLNLNKFMNMFMDNLNTAMKTHAQKKSRKIKKIAFKLHLKMLTLGFRPFFYSGWQIKTNF